MSGHLKMSKRGAGRADHNALVHACLSFFKGRQVPLTQREVYDGRIGNLVRSRISFDTRCVPNFVLGDF